MKIQTCAIFAFVVLASIGCTNSEPSEQASETPSPASTQESDILSPTNTVVGTEEPDALIYYTSISGLHRLADLQQGSEAIHTSDNSVEYRFSHDRKLVAFWEDSRGLWLSSLEHWNPQHVIVDDRRWSYGLMWTPDDTRIIAKVSRGAWQNSTEIPEGTETLAYNMLTKTTETWLWGDCGQIARNRQTGHLALVCHPDPWVLNPNPPIIALDWGGEYHPFKQQDYEVLLENLPFTSAWAWLDMGQWLVYSARNPEFDILTNPDVPLEQIYSVKASAKAIPLVSTDRLDNDLFAISEDQKLIAYWVSNRRDSRPCLEITNVDTSNVVRSYEKGFCIPFPEDLVWYPDSQHIAVIGFGENHIEKAIWSLDIATNDVTRFVLPDYVSVFTVAKADG